MTAQSEQTTQQKPGVISLRTVQGWHKAACDAEAVWFDRAEEDERFVSHDQWSDEERKVFKRRKQAPIQFNRIARDLHIQLGRQIKNRMKPVARPRGMGDYQKARGLTDLMEYYWQYNKGEFEQTQAVRDQLVLRGWLSYTLQREDISKEPIKIAYVPWREIKVDPNSKRHDLSDAQHLFRERWVPKDAAEAWWPEKAEQIATYAGTAETMGGSVHVRKHPTDSYNGASSVAYVNDKRDQVRIVECWYRRTVMAMHVKLPDGTVHTLMPGMPVNVEALMVPGAQVVEGPTTRIYYVYFCGDVVLEQGPSPYSHPYFPYVCYHAFRAHVSKQTEVVTPNEPFGMVRLAKDPQRTINSNWSAVNRMLKSRATTYKKGKVSKEDLAAIVNDPQALIGVSDHDDVKFHDWAAQASGLARLLPMSEDQLQAATGVNEASRGVGPESSGRAIMARQVQSETTNAILVDNQRLAINIGGWILAALIMQTVTEEKVVRITEDVGDRMVAINVTDPYKAAEYKAQGVEVLGSLSGMQYDIEIEEAPDESRQDADNEILMAMAQQLGPQGIVMFGDVLADGLETRTRDKVRERFSQIQQMQMGGAMGGQGAGPPAVSPSSPEAAEADLALAAQQAGAEQL
jgi:hypothetical protein